MSLYSIHAEQSVLGEILSNPHLLDDASAILLDGDFCQSNHRIIFSKMKHLKSMQKGIDPVTLSAQNPSVIEVDYLEDLRAARSNNYFNDHIEIIKSYALKRKIIDDSLTIIDKIKNEEEISSDELVSITQKNSSEVLGYAIGKQDTAKSYGELMPGYLARMEERARNTSGVTGLKTGFNELDQITAGLQRSDLIIVAARPSMGKTTFAMNLMENICLNGKRALVFSMEMPKEDLLDRTFASIGGINQTNLKRGNLTPLEQASFVRAEQVISGMDIIIDDEAGLTLSKLRARAIKHHRESPLSAIMIDYLQLMPGEGKETNRTQIISDISRGLKLLAKELGIPVIALSQLNRSLEQRQDKRPINSDLRESGAIEQDADIIMFVYRDEVYNPDSLDKGIGEIIIGKHRNGSLGTIKLKFEGAMSRFKNLNPSVDNIVEFKQPLELENARAKALPAPENGITETADEEIPLSEAHSLF